jgi:hypothetical protein
VRVTRLRARLRIAACAAALVAAPAALPAQGDPLTLDEVLELRRRGVSTRQILRNARDYCIAFTMTDSVERTLAELSTDTALIGGIRGACVVVPTAQLAPGVLVDDDLKAMVSLARFVSVDGLCTAGADSAGLRVENRRRQGGCAIGYPVDLGSTDVRIELTLAELAGEASVTAALGFGRHPASWNQYSFAITAVLYINDERVGTHQADEDVVGGISLGVGPRTSATFSRLRAQRIEGVAATR